MSFDRKKALQEARRVLLEESKAIADLVDKLDDDFFNAVELIYNCHGRVIVTGMGKSGLIGKKISATLASTGTPAIFLHAAEGAHGDLGIITDKDIVVAISYSGETAELVSILPFFQRFKVKMIALCKDKDTTLGRAAQAFLNIGVEKEACPLGITPTCSSTATLAMGDALAVALIGKRDFKKEDFAIRHPGGSLGRQLLLKVKDFFHHGDDVPRVKADVTLREAMFEMSRKRLGITTIVDDDDNLLGILTDGDLRRLFEKGNGVLDEAVTSVMTRNPKTITQDSMAIDALKIMEDFSITCLVVVSEKGSLQGVVHIHDILKAGLK